MNRITIIVLALLLYGETAFSQSVKQLHIGDRLPSLTLHEVINYPDSVIRLDDFRGKLVILDFWTVYCPSCIQAMPKMEALQEQFDDKIQIILVTSSTKEQVDKLFERSAIARETKLPSIIGDTTLTRLLEFRTVPTHVWVDEEGEIIHFTLGTSTNAENIARYLSGENLNLPVKKEYRDFGNVLYVPLFSEGNGRQLKHLKQYSIIMGKIDDDGGYGGSLFDEETGEQVGLKFINRPVTQLYLRAYGNANIRGDQSRVVVKVKDPTPFIRPSPQSEEFAEWRLNHLYSYESRMPPGKFIDARKQMQNDLSLYFGYQARIDTMNVQCLCIVQIEGMELPASTGGGYSHAIQDDGNHRLQLKNAPMTDVVQRLKPFFYEVNVPIVDLTGFTGKLDIELPLNIVDEMSLIKMLNQQGIDLVKKTLELEMLIIED